MTTKGLQGFVDALSDNEEYDKHFDYIYVPYQRRRILPQRPQGELLFARMARYDSYHLNKLYRSGQLRKFAQGVVDESANVDRKALVFLSIFSLVVLLVTLVLVASPK